MKSWVGPTRFLFYRTPEAASKLYLQVTWDSFLFSLWSLHRWDVSLTCFAPLIYHLRVFIFNLNPALGPRECMDRYFFLSTMAGYLPLCSFYSYFYSSACESRLNKLIGKGCVSLHVSQPLYIEWMRKDTSYWINLWMVKQFLLVVLFWNKFIFFLKKIANPTWIKLNFTKPIKFYLINIFQIQFKIKSKYKLCFNSNFLTFYTACR